MLMSVHLSIVSRMILSYKPEFQEFLNALATENGNHSDDIAAQILDVWMDKMPCVTQPERRKLLSLGKSILRYHFMGESGSKICTIVHAKISRSVQQCLLGVQKCPKV